MLVPLYQNTHYTALFVIRKNRRVQNIEVRFQERGEFHRTEMRELRNYILRVAVLERSIVIICEKCE